MIGSLNIGKSNMKIMKRSILIIVLLLAVLPMINAEVQTLGTYKQNTCVSLVQTCTNCTYVNLTSVSIPTSGITTLEAPMTQTGYNYNYTYCTTSALGKYIATTCGDVDGVNTCVSYDFLITPSGSNFGGNGLLGLSIIIIAVVYLIGFFGFFAKHEWISVFGGMAMLILGLYMMTNGIDVYRNFMTDALAWITVGIGVIFAITAGIEIIEENLL